MITDKKGKTMKQTQIYTAAAAGLLCTALLPLHAAASSVEDVYAAMRRIGLPESMVQEAKIQYQNTEHDENGMSINGNYFTYDVWADMVELYEDEIWNEVGNQFGVTKEAIKEAAAAEPEDTPAQTDPEFVQMTLEEKQAYVAAMPEEERASFIAGLSTAERNSIIKQMSADSQANIASGFIALGEQLGMHVSVDQLDGSGINYSVRNSDGTLIDVSTVGTGVDDTGWNTTVPVLSACAMILGAVGGVAYFALRTRREEKA